MEFRANVSLAEYTSWLVGGAADWFCLPESEADVMDALTFALNRQIPWCVLGGGTNVLVSDQGVEGLVIGLKNLVGVKTQVQDNRLRLECLAGTSKSELLKVFLKHKLPPALFLAGLPGDVGGGIVMNAGVSEAMVPREFYEIVDSFEVLQVTNGQIQKKHFAKDQVQWSYRHSTGWQPGIVTTATLSWELAEDSDILQKVRDANRNRLSKQPLDLPSCGSVFVNPPGLKAAQLIDRCGLKGFQIGGAQVSLKHANFIVNLGGATAADLRAVMDHVRATVDAKEGVSLHAEVVWLGRA